LADVLANVPKPPLASFFAAGDPAIARIGMAWATRPKYITIPVVTLYQGAFALSRAKDETVVRRARRIGVDDLAQSVRAASSMLKIGLDSLGVGGEKVFDVIEAEPDRLREVTGIGAVRAKRITDAWAEQKIVREIMVFFTATGWEPPGRFASSRPTASRPTARTPCRS
jgi:hypothetical protein